MRRKVNLKALSTISRTPGCFKPLNKNVSVAGEIVEQMTWMGDLWPPADSFLKIKISSIEFCNSDF